MKNIVLIFVWFGLSWIVHGCYPKAKEFSSLNMKWRVVFWFYIVMWPLYLVDMLSCIVAKRGHIR